VKNVPNVLSGRFLLLPMAGSVLDNVLHARYNTRFKISLVQGELRVSSKRVTEESDRRK